MYLGFIPYMFFLSGDNKKAPMKIHQLCSRFNPKTVPFCPRSLKNGPIMQAYTNFLNMCSAIIFYLPTDAVQYFLNYLAKARFSEKEVPKVKCVLIFSTNFDRNISHSEKN